MIYKILRLTIRHLHGHGQEWNTSITQKKLNERFDDDLLIVYQNEPGWNSPPHYTWRSKR